MLPPALRERSSGDSRRLAFAGLAALVVAAVGLLGRRGGEHDAVDVSPRALHTVQVERRELHLRSGTLRDVPSAAERRCAWPNEATRQVSARNVDQAAADNRERVFGSGLCSVTSFVAGDLDGDRGDDVVAVIECSMPDVGEAYQRGAAVFVNARGRGLVLASMQELPFRVRLERLCDELVTMEVDIDEYRKDVALHFGSRYDDDTSSTVTLRLRNGRLAMASVPASSMPTPR